MQHISFPAFIKWDVFQSNLVKKNSEELRNTWNLTAVTGGWNYFDLNSSNFVFLLHSYVGDVSFAV